MRSGRVKPDTVDWSAAIQLVDLYGLHDRTAHAEDDAWIAAYYIWPELSGGSYVPISELKFLEGRLNSAVDLQIFEDCVNQIAQLEGEPAHYTLGRHSIAPNKFSKLAERFIGHMGEVIAVLDRGGLMPMLAYGSLLGAVREKTFIPHDDDVDLLFLAKGRNRAQAVEHRANLISQLREMGYAVSDVGGPHLNFQVTSKAYGVPVDLFPFWVEDGVAFLHMERMEIRGIPEDLLLPRSTCELNGMVFPSPGKPSAFLSERYGSDWAVSKKYFEWTWPLIN